MRLLLVLTNVAPRCRKVGGTSFHTHRRGHFQYEPTLRFKNVGSGLELALGAWLDLSSDDSGAAIVKALQAEELALAGNQLYITRTIRALSACVEGNTAEGVAELEEIWRRSEGNRNVCNNLVLAGILGVGLLLDGQYERATRWLDERFLVYQRIGARALHLGFLRLYLGEAYLGLVLREPRPDVGTVMKNLGFLVRSLPFARRRARRALEEAAKYFHADGATGARARAELGLGLVSRAAGDKARARRHLSEARDLATAADAADIRERAHLALDSIGG
jgi:tetratricopeptide (TPR) repeat protein